MIVSFCPEGRRHCGKEKDPGLICREKLFAVGDLYHYPVWVTICSDEKN